MLTRRHLAAVAAGALLSAIAATPAAQARPPQASTRTPGAAQATRTVLPLALCHQDCQIADAEANRGHFGMSDSRRTHGQHWPPAIELTVLFARAHGPAVPPGVTRD
jgi:hypothetical protein